MRVGPEYSGPSDAAGRALPLARTRQRVTAARNHWSVTAAAELAQPGPSPERAEISVTRDTAAVLRTKRGAPFPSRPLDLDGSIRTVRSGLLINPYPLDDDARGAEPENDLRAFSGRRSDSLNHS